MGSSPKISAPEKGSPEINLSIKELGSMPVASYNVKLKYNSKILKPKSIVTKGTLSENWKTSMKELDDGRLEITGDHSSYLKGDGVLCKVLFDVIGSKGEESILAFEDFKINGAIPVKTENGSVKITDNVSRVLEEKGIPSEYVLEQNYPNPFNPSTTIHYAIVNDAYVSLAVYDALGRLAAMLENGNQKSGYHEVVFDAKKFTSGVYYYVLRISNRDIDKILTRKMILIK